MSAAYSGAGIGGTIPASGLCRAKREWNEQTRVNQGLAWHPSALPPGIVWPSLQAFEESQQLVVGPVATRPSVGRRGLGQNFLLEGEIGIEVNLGGFDGFMA